MNYDFKWLGLFLGNCILIFVIQLMNDTFASMTLNLYPYALCIFTPILLVSYTTGLISVFITGLILDSTTTLSFGTTSILFSIVYTAYSYFSQQYKTYKAWHYVCILLSANAIIFIFLSLFIDLNNYSSPHFWVSILLNLLFSQLLLLFITPWFLSLQCRLIGVLTLKFKNQQPNNVLDAPKILNS